VVEELRRAGVIVLRRGDHVLLDSFERAITGVQALSSAITGWENHWTIANLVAQFPDGVSARSKAVLAAAERMTPETYRTLLLRREDIRRSHEALGPVVDALIAPASPGPAPRWSGDRPGETPAPRPTGDFVFNAPSSVLGAPVVTVPLTTVAGLPMGIQVLGQPHSDARVTGIARWMLKSLPWVSA
jgi:Asp-tRNA(Asn)/Glu-tRNA(Gln) amidotransferase A subunit family amidase